MAYIASTAHTFFAAYTALEQKTSMPILWQYCFMGFWAKSGLKWTYFLVGWGGYPLPPCAEFLLLAYLGKIRQKVFDLLPEASDSPMLCFPPHLCLMWWCCLYFRWYFGICICAHWENEKRKRHQSQKEDLWALTLQAYISIWKDCPPNVIWKDWPP